MSFTTRFRRTIAQWLPPALVRLLQILRDGLKGAGCHYAGTAWPAAPAASWSNETIVAPRKALFKEWRGQVQAMGPLGSTWPPVVRESLDLVEHNRYVCAALGLSLAAQGKASVSALDWGGACGDYALLARRFCPDTRFEWSCAELPVICVLGRELNPAVTFIADERWKQNTYDLGFSSSAIQYVLDWQDLVGALAAASREWLFLTRLPLVFGAPSFVFEQRAPEYGTRYPGWAFNRDELVAVAKQAGFGVAHEFLLGKWMHVHHAPEQPVTMGLLFRRVAPPPSSAHGKASHSPAA